jgi:hypothetical protein
VPWRLSDDVEAFADRAWDLLAAGPAEQTVALTIVESLRAGHRWSDSPALFGWYPDGSSSSPTSRTRRRTRSTSGSATGR